METISAYKTSSPALTMKQMTFCWTASIVPVQKPSANRKIKCFSQSWAVERRAWFRISLPTTGFPAECSGNKELLHDKCAAWSPLAPQVSQERQFSSFLTHGWNAFLLIHLSLLRATIQLLRHRCAAMTASATCRDTT